MLSAVVILSLLAGMAFAQAPSEYSECADVNEIMTVDCESHLTYLKTKSSDSYNYFMEVSNLKDPIALVRAVAVDKACNESDHLKEYYKCVFEHIKTCLDEVNTTVSRQQSLDLPHPNNIADAVGVLCANQKELNTTCYDMKKPKVDQCAMEVMRALVQGGMGPGAMPEGGAMPEDGDDHATMTEDEHAYHTQISMEEKQKVMLCDTNDNLLDCLDEHMAECGGYNNIIREYFVGMRPAVCDDLDNAAQSVSVVSFGLLLLAAFFTRLL